MTRHRENQNRAKCKYKEISDSMLNDTFNPSKVTAIECAGELICAVIKCCVKLVSALN